MILLALLIYGLSVDHLIDCACDACCVQRTGAPLDLTPVR